MMNTSFPEHLKKDSSVFWMVRSSAIGPFLSIFLNDPDLFLREVVEVVDEAVDLEVGGVDLAPEVNLFVFGSDGSKLLVQSGFYPSLKNS
jgi:hypothetical protein